VDDLIWQDGRVVGVRAMQAGKPFEAHAGLVIGADGRHSIVARKTAASRYNEVPSFAAAIYAYLSQVESAVTEENVLQFAAGPGCDILCCPCNDELYVVLLIVGLDEYDDIRSMVDYEARLRTVPTLAPRLVSATCVSRLFRAPAREIRGYFREPFGPGWALVGDAGYYSHPAAANGIHDALRSAELLYEHVEHAWVEGLAAETYLEGYRSIRDDENREPYYDSYQRGSVNPFRDPELAARVREDSVRIESQENQDT
jgi:flavin-dependent dehydrogenase